MGVFLKRTANQASVSGTLLIAIDAMAIVIPRVIKIIRLLVVLMKIHSLRQTLMAVPFTSSDYKLECLGRDGHLRCFTLGLGVLTLRRSSERFLGSILAKR